MTGVDITRRLVWESLLAYFGGAADQANLWYQSYNVHLEGRPCNIDPGKVLDYLDIYMETYDSRR